ncbi:MAG: hypothetical protein IKB10_01390 [Alphaproteobacteria bacterium]|nr:hypothetical protein [Alphaproteobacteria bacterium]
MYKYLFSVSLCLVMCAANAAPGAAGRGRASMANQMNAAPRAVVVSKTQIAAAPVLDVAPDEISTVVASDVATEVAPALAVTPEEMLPAQKDNREIEKQACIGNNIGLGNTFVWASRYSNLNNYSTMVEDVNFPDNNTCFVKVELKTLDERIEIDDIQPKYYEWNRDIVCGDWVDSEMLRQRILDAKKKNRTWATVAGAVGGAGVGVGAMELFGNRWIGGDVMGQKQFENGSAQQLRSRILALKGKDDAQYKKWEIALKELQDACKDLTDKNKLDADLKKACEETYGIVSL